MVRKVQVYADGADLAEIKRLGNAVCGYTTNPSLLKSAGVVDYETFAKTALQYAAPAPVSFEVLSDDLDEMERQARIIASWGDRAVVKIPIVNSRGESTVDVIRRLSEDRIWLNVTAVMTGADVCRAVAALRNSGHIISIFAGRIADTGRDPETVVRDAAMFAHPAGQKILWASTREVFNWVQAERSGADIITMTPAMIEKMLAFEGKNLDHYTRETVQQFAKDAEGLEL